MDKDLENVIHRRLQGAELLRLVRPGAASGALRPGGGAPALTEAAVYPGGRPGPLPGVRRAHPAPGQEVPLVRQRCHTVA
jgi:hypothetical protein